MGSYIRTHTPGEATGSGTTVAATVSAVVTPGNTLVAAVTVDSSQAVSAISVPGGESASWVRVSSNHVGSTVVRVEVWAIKTTIAWTAATAVTVTFVGAADGRAINVFEFNSISLTAAATDHQGGFAETKTVTAGEVSVGDMVIALAVSYCGGSSLLRLAGSGTTQPAGTTVGTGSQRPGYRFENSCQVLIPSADGAFSRSWTSQNAVAQPDARPMDAVLVVLEAANYAPNAPTLTSMASGGTVNRANTNRARWAFSDDNPGDSQSKFNLYYQIDSSGTWTTVTGATPNQFYDFPSGIAAGDYEWQVETYDSLGALGPRSTSGFFTAADQPDGPTMTYPTAGQSVDQLEHVDWSSPDQEKYQVRRVADDAGDPDPATIYFDSGEVSDTTTRTLALNFATNNRVEHVQVRVYADGLWSEYVDVDVDVSYTQPPTPTYLLYPDPSDGSLLLAITNPDPAEGDPAAIYNRILIDDSAEGLRIDRNGTNVSPNGVWRYRVPVSGYSYTPDRLIVEAVADNGITARSAT